MQTVANGSLYETKYEPAKLYDAGGDITKDWYVQYYFLDPATGIMERFKPTFNINRKHTLAERYSWGKEAVKFMNERLQAGYDPFEEQKKLKQARKSNSAPDETILTTVSAVKDQLVEGATPNAKDTYRGMYNRFQKFIDAKKYNHLSVKEFDTDMCYEFQEYLKDEMKLAKKTVNATLSHVGLFWDQKKIRTAANGFNPFRKVTPVKNKDYRGRKKSTTAKDNDFVPLTSDEMDTIIEYYNRIGAKKFLRVLGMIYYGWTRPVEITRLKISDIDLKHRSIRFLKENTKDHEFAHVQIIDELYDLLVSMKLHTYPSSYYLFSTDLVPGEFQLTAWRHLTEAWWNPHVVDTLGIQKKMYSIKHTGNIEYIQKNKGKIDMKWQQMQNRHSTSAVTEAYIKRLGVYFVDTTQFKFRNFI